ncbi:MAG: hypothetical protein WCU80_07275 [Paludibacteraceae bacterium]
MDIERVLLVHNHANAAFVLGHKEKHITFIRIPMVTHANNFHDPGITTTHIASNFSTNRSNSWQLKLFFDICKPVPREITTDSIGIPVLEIAIGIDTTSSNSFSWQEGATCGMPTISTGTIVFFRLENHL